MEDIVLGPRSLPTPEDAKILQMTVELSHQLGIPTNPTIISWADRIGWMKIPFGQALFTFGEMILPKTAGKVGARGVEAINRFFSHLSQKIAP